jgi:5'-nucleotidase
MRYLVTNDDGIAAPGLWAVVRALQEVGEVVVVAPDREQSGVGTSFSLHNPVHVRRITRRGVRAHAVDGTPADAVLLGLGELYPEGIDAVISGINPGSNMGRDAFLSGTVGAALHGHFKGIPSLAISMSRLKRPKYSTGAFVARVLVPLIAGNDLFKDMLLNVTVPNFKPEALQGVEITRLMAGGVNLEVTAGDNGRQKHYWIGVEARKRPRKKDIPEGTDVWAIREKRVSITPLHTDLISYYGASEVLPEVLRPLRSAIDEVHVTPDPA